MKKEVVLGLIALVLFITTQVLVMLFADTTVITKVIILVGLFLATLMLTYLFLSILRNYGKLLKQVKRQNEAITLLQDTSKNTYQNEKRIHNLEIEKEQIVRQQTQLFDLVITEQETQQLNNPNHSRGK